MVFKWHPVLVMWQSSGSQVAVQCQFSGSRVVVKESQMIVELQSSFSQGAIKQQSSGSPVADE